MQTSILCLLFFFFNDTATTEIYTLSLHDALPIWRGADASPGPGPAGARPPLSRRGSRAGRAPEARRGIRLERSEEHTSELQSRLHLVCRLLLEKKKKNKCPRDTRNIHTGVITLTD